MKSRKAWILIVCLLLASVYGCGQKGSDAKAVPDVDAEPNVAPEKQAAAIAEIKRLGGKVERDLEHPDQPVISVNLSGCRELIDTDLAILKELTQLRMLDLDNCDLITDAGLEHLKGLTQLQGLNLGGTQVTDAGVKKLKEALPKCQVKYDRIGSKLAQKSDVPKVFPSKQAAAIAMIKKLGGKVRKDQSGQIKWLHFYYNPVTDTELECLKGLTQLQSLYLNRTKVTDAGLEHLKGLTQLQSLDLTNNTVTDAGLEHLKGLTQLKELNLAYCRGVTDPGLEHLKGLTQLRRLTLYSTQVTDAGLEHLAGLNHLQSLSLTGTKVTDTGLEHLAGLMQLERLYLNRTKVTGAGVAKLQKALPNCKIRH